MKGLKDLLNESLINEVWFRTNNPDYINESSEQIDEAQVEELSEKIYDGIKSGKAIEEGFFGAIVGGIAGLTVGASIMKAVCKVLGLKEGPLYNLLTSKLVCTVAGGAIGKSM